MKLRRLLVLALTLPVLGATPLQGQQTSHARCQVVTRYVFEPEPPAAPTEGAAFDIVPSFDASVSTSARIVIARAISEWEDAILQAGEAPNTYNITFRFAPLTGSVVGQALTCYNSFTGSLKNNATITFDSTGTTFFVDPTPDDDSEYDELGMNGPASTDLLSVARHEIGHAVGFVGFPPVTSLVQSDVFDPNRIDVPLTPGDPAHVDGALFPDDLMAPSIGDGQRRAIRPYFHQAFVARAWDHDVPMTFVDWQFTGQSFGTADAPWSTVVAGHTAADDGDVILIRRGTYADNLPQTFQTKNVLLTTTRGGGMLLR